MISNDKLEPANGNETVHPEEPKRWYERWYVWVTVFVFLIGGFWAEPKIRNRYHRWTENRQMERAIATFEKGDYSKSMLDARGILEVNPGNLEANRIIAKSLEALDSPSALAWRIRLAGLIPNDAENCLALAKDALDAGDVELARRAIQNLKSEDRNVALFHEVSARLAMNRREPASAEEHWEQACQLEPGVDRYRLSLATLRLNSKKAGARAGAIKTLEEIAKKPALALQALRTLLSDALGQPERERLSEFAASLGTAADGNPQSADLHLLREWYTKRVRDENAPVKAYADALVAASGSTFDDKILRLSALREIDSVDFMSYMEELRTAALSNPDQIFRLITWMNNNTLSIMAYDFVLSLPAETAAKSPVCVAVAETYASNLAWAKLRRLVEKGSWKEIDYMRRAFHARALDRLEEPDKAAAVWKEAVAATRGRADTYARLDQLARMADSWGWQARWEELLWELSSYGQCPRWALDALWKIVFSSGDTSKMQRVSGAIAKIDPGDVAARNNYVFLSLLLRTEEGNPSGAAKALHDQNPSNPLVTTTYAFSLYQQGKAAQAAATMAALKPEDLRSPIPAFYYGIFLTAEGRSAEAAEFVRIGTTRTLLAEEQAILKRLKDGLAKQSGERP